MVKRKAPDEDTTVEAYVRHKEAQRQEKNKRLREAYARQKASKIKQQQGNLVPELNAQDRICEVQLNVPGEKCAARNTAVETLSPTETKLEERNRKSAAITFPTNISDKGKAQVSRLSIYEIGSSSSRTLRQQNRKRSNNKPAGKEPKCRKLVAPGEVMVLPPQQPCQHCHATRFYLEPEGFCCRKRQISLVPISTPPELWHLYTSDSIEADEFRTHIRTYNSSFAFTSFGVKK